MKDFCKYLTQSEKDLKWGMVVTVAGYTNIQANMPYPLLQHPVAYRFSEQNKRMLHEYQLIYITRGQGTFESKKGGKHQITPGTIIILFPNEHHCYLPDKNTGWTEYYIGFKGHIIDNLVKEGFFSHNNPILKIGIHELIVHLYHDIFNCIKTEKSGYQQLASGITSHLVGKVLYQATNRLHNSYTDKLVQKIKIHITENFTKKIDWKALGENVGVSYSNYRKTFKEYVGMAPGEYQLQLKKHKAIELLQNPDYSLKEIAEKIGFQNEYYFNTFFKLHTNITPGYFRKLRGERFTSKK